jgi:hypothetical protein
MAATKEELLADIRAKLAAAGKPTSHFGVGATDQDAICDGIAQFVSDNAVVGGATPTDDSVTNAKLANVATATIKGRTTAGTGDPEDLTVTQVTAMLNTVTDVAKGLAPASGGGTTNYLRADGTWAAPSGTATLPDGDYGDLTVSGSGTSVTIDNNTISFAKMADIATDRLVGRDTAGTGDPEALTVGGGLEFTGTGGIQRSALTGDVTASAGSNSTSVANDAITNSKLANMGYATFKGRNTIGTGDPEDVTAAQAVALLPTFTSDAKGVVPASGGGIESYLRADGTWASPTAGNLPELQQKYAAISYIYPTGGRNGTYWDALEDYATAGQLTSALFNPQNGPGYQATYESGGGVHSAYTARLATAQAAGIRVFGYQPTNYFDEAGTHSYDQYAGSVGARWRFTAATSDVITFVGNGTTASGGAPGSSMAMTFPAGFGPIAVKSWASDAEAGVTLPGGLAVSTSYWLRPTGSTPIAAYTLHPTEADALAGTNTVNITSTGGGSGNGPFWLDTRKTPALVQNILDEFDRWFTLYPDLDGVFFDEAQVSLSGYDATFDAILAHRDSNHPTKLICVNGTPHSAARADLYDLFMIENSWSSFESGAQPIPSYLTADYTYSSKAWMGCNGAGASDIADAVTFSRTKHFGHVSIVNGSYSSPLVEGVDGYTEQDLVDLIVAGNQAVESAENASAGMVWTGYTSTSNGVGNDVKAAGVTTANLLENFTMPSNNRLTNVGSTTKTFHAVMTLSYIVAGAGSRYCHFRFF